jgi:FAD-dependent oxidoreductase domain-containing protein 1
MVADRLPPRHVLIVGGGVMGAAVACFLARDHGVAVTVVERDPAGTQASSALSASSIRQQFSQPVNVALSAWSLGFLRRVGNELAVPGAIPPAVGLVEPGYLYLARAGQDAALRQRQARQAALGAAVALLEPQALAQRFPWLHTADLGCGALGLSGEGWFDGPALWQAFVQQARHQGARWIQATASGFETAGDRVTALRCTGGQRLAADAFVIAAGAWSTPLGAALGVMLPVAAKKRDVFVLDCPAALPGCPLLIDPGGVWCRPEGRGFIAGAPPRDGSDPADVPLDAVDHALFDEVIWPALARRVPAMEALRVRSAWSGYYEMNTFDANGLAGALPGWTNAFAACGFSGHGMQQAPAVGCGLAAQIAGGTARAPDLAPLSPARVAAGRPLREDNVI